MGVHKIVVFGHSHVWSVRRAVTTLPPDSKLPPIEVPLCGTREMPGSIVTRNPQGKMVLTATLSALLYKLSAEPTAAETWLLSMVQGNYYNQMGMLASKGQFDFVLPSAPQLPLQENAVVLPYAAVRASLLETMGEAQDYIALIAKSEFADRTIIAGSPPPPESDEYIRELVAKEGITDEPTAAYVRLKLWHLQDQLHAEMCAGKKLKYLRATPAGTQDASGFLRPECVKDAVHANANWALKFLEDAARLASIDRK